MEDKDKTRKQPIDELAKLRKQVTELEKSESDRNNVEEKQKKTEERHKISPEFLSDGYLRVDLKGKITDCNSAFLNHTGYSREDIVNKYFTKLPTIRLKDIPRYIKMFNSARRGKLPKSIEYKWIHKDETTHWGESYFGIIRKNRKISGFNIVTRDITRRKRAEEEIKISEKKYRAIFEQAADSIVLVDGEAGKLVEFNERAFENLGYTREEFRKLTIPDFEVSESAEEVTKHINKIIREGYDSFETKHRRKNGEIRNVFVSSKAISIGGRDFVQSIWRDITERKKTEEILIESEAKYRILFESIADPIFIFDQKTHRFLDCNKSVLERYGYTLKELQALTPEQLHPPEELEDVEKNIDDEEDSSPHNYTHITKKGEKFQVEIHTSPLKYQGREAWISIVRDITERKKAEEQLQLHSNIMTNLSEGINLVRASDGTLIYTNPQFEKMFGYGPDELIGKHVSILNASPDNRGKEQVKEILNSLEKKNKWKGEIENIEKDGTVFFSYASIIKSKHHEFGEVFISAQIDITENKQAEEELKHSQKELQKLAAHMQVATEQERGLIASELHDEVGQALTGLKMDIYAIKNKMSKDQKKIPSEFQRMENLLDETIRKLRQIYSDLRPNLLDHFGVGEAMRQHCIDFQEQSGIKCTFYQDPEEIVLDENRSIALYRIIQGAINNVKWHSRATKVDVRLEEIGPNLKLTIKDNGIGIKEEQIKSSNSFGLIGMRERARYLGGELKIKGIPDKGTTVILEIPKQKSH